MRNLLVTLCLVLAACACSRAAAEEQRDRFMLIRVQKVTPEQREFLRSLESAAPGTEIWKESRRDGSIDLRIRATDLELVEAVAPAYMVVEPDLAAKRAELFHGEGESFFDSYRTYNEYVAKLDELEAAYPLLVTKFSLGTSVEGRELWTLLVTGATDQPKTGVMYHGGQHGNEIMGPPSIMRLILHLLDNYGTDPDITALVDGIEFFLLPIMNPDGYEEGGRYNANGYDLNRNWGGPLTHAEAWSQPETAAMRDFFAAHDNIVSHVDLHSYSELFLLPWGHTVDLPPDYGLFLEIGGRMNLELATVRGRTYRTGTIRELLYPVIGGSIDYTYDRYNTWALAIEIGRTFGPHPSEIEPTTREITLALLELSRFVSDCDQNDTPDAEEIQAGAMDCNANGVLDICERPDSDGDALIDRCDPDDDNDGVADEEDDCPVGPVGAPVDRFGAPIGDTDGGCSLDLGDFRRFGSCLSSQGPGVPASNSSCALRFDTNGDDRFDLIDFASFQDNFGIMP